MSLETLADICETGLIQLREKGALKGAEYIICGIKSADGEQGFRYYLKGHGKREFIRMNSNSYLGLSFHPEVLRAEEESAGLYGVGPGAVRFISGTCEPHIRLEDQLAEFHGREACLIYSSAYSAVMGVLPQLINEETMVISDSLNHNSIINAIRLSGKGGKKIYAHLDMNDLECQIQHSVGKARRICIVTDGIFSIRGDYAPLDEIDGLRRDYQHQFDQGIITVIDDSHGVGVFGPTGRGVEEYTGVQADILIATLGKAFGVNGGYAVSGRSVIEYLRQVSPFYVYSNPITPSEAAAASASLSLVDGPAGGERRIKLLTLVDHFEKGLIQIGLETISSPHPVVPALIRDTRKTKELVAYLFDKNILVTGLFYPVVPKGEEEIRFQLSTELTRQDVDFVLKQLDNFTWS